MHNPPHPGAVFKELYVDELGLTQKEICAGSGLGKSMLSKFLNGKYPCTPEIDMRLSKLFGKTPGLYLRMQTAFDMFHAEKELRTQLRKIKPMKLKAA
jgi:addiction module HigA family antidote